MFNINIEQLVMFSSLCKQDHSSSHDLAPSLGVDMEFVHFAYSILMNLVSKQAGTCAYSSSSITYKCLLACMQPQTIQRSTLKATITGLLKESKNHRRYSGNHDYLRVHLILMEV